MRHLSSQRLFVILVCGVCVVIVTVITSVLLPVRSSLVRKEVSTLDLHSISPRAPQVFINAASVLGHVSPSTQHLSNHQPPSKQLSDYQPDSRPDDSPRGSGAVQLPVDKAYMSRPVSLPAFRASNQSKVVVMYNRPDWLFPGDPHYQRVFDTCPVSCTMTDNKTLLPSADAVWVAVDRLVGLYPPSRRPPQQMWVAYFIESPVHFMGSLRSPKWSGQFNWTFSYRRDSDFFRPYGEFALRDPPAGKNYTQIALGKSKPVAWYVSNCQTESKREDYVRELRRYIHVDMVGRCSSTSCPGLAERSCMDKLTSTYFFYLAFENSFCHDYVTEKVFKTFDNVDVIPVVRGALNYSRFLPPNTYLDTLHFPSPQHLAERLLALMDDVTTYSEMLRTKDHFHVSERSWVWPNLKPFCHLCQTLHLSPPPAKVYPDLVQWAVKEQCWDRQDY